MPNPAPYIVVVFTVGAVLNPALVGVVSGLGAGIGFTIALILMAGLRERLEMSDIPESLKGVPIAFIVAGLMSLAFMGFSGFALK